MAILITGGAGYIGSNTVRQLLGLKLPLVVLDSLSTGHRWAVPPEVTFVQGNAGDEALVRELLRKHRIEIVLHFAAFIRVDESMQDPLKYYGNNVLVSHALLNACVKEKISKFIFSSSAAVYGAPTTDIVTESAPTSPISPYGTSKLVTEWMLRDVARSYPLSYVALRYFNVAGARLDGTLGQATPFAESLIKVASEVASGKRPSLAIFGTGYPTKDGTAIRDYIHIEDLAAAHVLAARYLLKGGSSEVLNCGYGSGYSVREVVEMMKKVSGVNFTVTEGPPRAGDMAALIANADRLKKILNWRPRCADLELICRTAYEWEKRLTQLSRAANPRAA